MKSLLVLALILVSFVSRASDENNDINVTIIEEEIMASDALSRINSLCGIELDPTSLRRPNAMLTFAIRNVSCDTAINLLYAIDSGRDDSQDEST